jgi:hypothetical protein
MVRRIGDPDAVLGQQSWHPQLSYGQPVVSGASDVTPQPAVGLGKVLALRRDWPLAVRVRLIRAQTRRDTVNRRVMNETAQGRRRLAVLGTAAVAAL